jgi:hypothetical protein
MSKSNTVTLKQKFEKALADSGPELLEKLAPMWKAIIEAEKTETDIANATTIARFERVKFWVPIIFSLVSTLALVATLVFQVTQFKENTILAKETSEDAQWREALTKAQDTNGPEGVFGVLLLKSFLKSDRYGQQARQTLVMILGHMGNREVFDSVFPDLMANTKWWNLGDRENFWNVAKDQ